MKEQASFADGRLLICRGDLTGADTEAIVNAANSALAGGGGVDGAIHRAAGAELLSSACTEWISKNKTLPPGQAMLTPGFKLSAKWIIHTVGPVWHGGDKGEPQTLSSAYTESLKLAAENGIKSVSFPAISCGIYRFPMEEAIPIALTAVKRALKNDLPKEARFYLLSAQDFKVWVKGAENIFG